jgi:small GTP-binding protein
MKTTIIKFIIIGDVNTGKSSLLHHFAKDQAFCNTVPTIAFDFHRKRIIDQRYGPIDFDLWDTSGAEKSGIASVMQTYYRGASGVILCFDLSERSTYDNLITRWLPRLRSSNLGNNYRCIMVGNKSDLMVGRSFPGEVTLSEEAQQYALTNHLHYVELSSLRSEINLIRQPFLLLAKQLITEGICLPIELKPKPIVVLDDEQGDEQKSGCCPSYTL